MTRTDFFLANHSILGPVLAVLALPLVPGAVLGTPHNSPPPNYAPDRVLVAFQPGTPGAAIAELKRNLGASELSEIPGIGVHVLGVPYGSVEAKLAILEHNPNVLYAEPDFYRVLYIPNEGDDPEPTGTGNEYFIEQWGLNNTGQLHSHPDPVLGLVSVQGAVDADIDAPEGWDISTGNPAVKIAVLDTGVDCRSAANPLGSLEFTSPGKCVEQVSFVTDYSSTNQDIVSHGTHVAGIAAAETDNDIGSAGVGFDSSVGALKACFEYEYDALPPFGFYVITGVCPVSSSAAAMQYAADNGYHVINMSYASDQVDEFGEPLGLGGYTATELAAVNYAWEMGVVLVGAAGNADNTVKSYPAAYDNVIAVGATDHYDDRASFSSFGNDWVSLMAPGEDIISTVPNDLCIFYSEILGVPFDPNNDSCLDWYSGTSMASPHVAGAAGLVWAHLFSDQLADPAGCTDLVSGLPCNQVVRQRLENGADVTGALGQNILAWSQHGRLNLYGALTDATPPPPAPPAAPAGAGATDNTDGTARVYWTDASDNEEGFEVQRETWHPKRKRWQSNTLVATTAADVESIVDASGAGLFRYSVRAVNAVGASAWSAWAEVTVTDASSGGGGKPCHGKKCP